MSTDLAIETISSALFPKARRTILALLFTHPDEAFFLREIVDLTGLGVGHVQRELSRMVKAGVFVSEVKGRHRYFRVSKECPVYAEMRGLVVKTSGVVELVRAGLAPIGSKIDVAFIYGSVARQEERESSDLDLLVVGEATLSEVVGVCRRLEAQLHRPVNPSVFPTLEFRGKVAQGNHFLNSVLQAPKLFVIKGKHELEAILGQRVDQKTPDVGAGNS